MRVGSRYGTPLPPGRRRPLVAFPRSRQALLRALRRPKGASAAVALLALLALIGSGVAGALETKPRLVLFATDGRGVPLGSIANAGPVDVFVPRGWTIATGSDERVAFLLAPQQLAAQPPVSITVMAPDATRATKLALAELKRTSGYVVVDRDLLAFVSRILAANLEPPGRYAIRDVSYRAGDANTIAPAVELAFVDSVPWRGVTPASDALACALPSDAVVEQPNPELDGILVPETGREPEPSSRPTGPALGVVTERDYVHAPWRIAARLPEGVWSPVGARDLTLLLGSATQTETWRSGPWIFSAGYVPGAALEPLAEQIAGAFPDVHRQHHLAAVVGEAVRPAFEVGELERLRAHGTAGPEKQQRHEQAARHQAFSSRAVMAYLKASGSSWSRRSPPVSPLGYIRQGSFGPRECGSARSCPVLQASQFVSQLPNRRRRAATARSRVAKRLVTSTCGAPCAAVHST